MKKRILRRLVGRWGARAGLRDHRVNSLPPAAVAAQQPGFRFWSWLRKPLVWILGIPLASLVTWGTGFLDNYFPSAEQARLALKNARTGQTEPVEHRFRVVLCWLENDGDGENAKLVAQAFTSIEGVELVRSSRVVTASGAADHWREAMRTEARVALQDWGADLAVVGLVKQSGEALSLWFVPAYGGEGSLGRGDRPYELDNATLGQDFRDDFRSELATVALVAVAPLARTEVRGRVLEHGGAGLRNATGRAIALPCP